MVLRPLPDAAGPWGVLSPLLGTPYEPLISVVDGEDLSHALHGMGTPLMNAIGRPPARLLKMAPQDLCRIHGNCVMFSREDCYPCPRVPLCFEAPLNDLASAVASVVVQAWKEGRYVVVVEGDEFSL